MYCISKELLSESVWRKWNAWVGGFWVTVSEDTGDVVCGGGGGV